VPAGKHVLYGDIVSTLNIADAKGYTDGHPPGVTAQGRRHALRHRAGGDPA
jgi:hypothetical protein